METVNRETVQMSSASEIIELMEGGFNMAFVNAFGVSVSHDCAGLIEDLKEDILLFGEDKVVAVWCRKYGGVTQYIDYDFIVKGNPLVNLI